MVKRVLGMVLPLGNAIGANMNLQLTEIAARVLVDDVVDWLIMKEDDQVLHESLVNFLALLVRERRAQVDAGKLGADSRRTGRHTDGLEIHGDKARGGESAQIIVQFIYWADASKVSPRKIRLLPLAPVPRKQSTAKRPVRSDRFLAA